ncbi:MAG: Rieske 2Fe-2S domain-containing protein [Coriobacteriia bacterium]|nr:Rieske 2Fe-2S domain-containing protein [Coriobacteriia bacterium]
MENRTEPAAEERIPTVSGGQDQDESCIECMAQTDATPSDANTVDRRDFVAWIAAMSMGATAVFAVTMVGRAVVPPGRSIEGKTKVGKLAVGREDELEPGKPVLAEYGDDVLYVVKMEDSSLKVYNAACPHVACKLAYNESSKEFDCPCHASSFTIDGKLLGGPAPRDMIEAEFEVVEGEIVVSGFRV